MGICIFAGAEDEPPYRGDEKSPIDSTRDPEDKILVLLSPNGFAALHQSHDVKHHEVKHAELDVDRKPGRGAQHKNKATSGKRCPLSPSLSVRPSLCFVKGCLALLVGTYGNQPRPRVVRVGLWVVVSPIKYAVRRVIVGLDQVKHGSHHAEEDTEA